MRPVLVTKITHDYKIICKVLRMRIETHNECLPVGMVAIDLGACLAAVEYDHDQDRGVRVEYLDKLNLWQPYYATGRPFIYNSIMEQTRG